MDDCVFCKIISGEIPCAKIYEDDDVLAFLDISQTTKGHALVVSKKHYDNFLATPKEIMHKVMDVAQTIGQSQIRNLKASGVNILTNCYAAAGQTVMHFHVHVIPRYKNSDGLVIEFKENKLLGELSLPQIADSIKKNM
ncbi:MAG: HIT family protein [Erysipelotrichaceae bacterium]|nr:HIT family protein [Erysipelotrichaceae bacterium]